MEVDQKSGTEKAPVHVARGSLEIPTRLRGMYGAQATSLVAQHGPSPAMSEGLVGRPTSRMPSHPKVPNDVVALA